MPPEWVLGRFCEEHLATSLENAARQPFGTCLDVLALRAYAEVYQAFHDPKVKNTDLPDSEMLRQVKLNQFRRQFRREPVLRDD